MMDPDLEPLLRQSAQAGLPDLCDLPIDVARQVYRGILAAADRPPVDVRVSDDLAVATRADGASPAVPVRVYRPRGEASGPLPMILYLHGGGYLLGDVAGYDSVCRQLCADSGAMVVSADYRLAPEHAWPAAPQDAWTAACWLVDRAAALGGDAARVALAGDSAGAVLAFSVALRSRAAGGPRWSAMGLLYPPAAGGHPGDFPSHRLHADGPTLTARTMLHFSRHAFGPAGRAPDEQGAPLQCADYAGLPPTLLLLAGLDPLLDEGRALAGRMAAQGHAPQVVEYPGLPHGFISMAGRLRLARHAQRQFAALLAESLDARVP